MRSHHPGNSNSAYYFDPQITVRENRLPSI